MAWDYSGASHLDELDHTLRERVMVRRRKEDVMQYLPALETDTVPFEVNLTSYWRVRDEVLARLAEVRVQLGWERELFNGLSVEV